MVFETEDKLSRIQQILTKNPEPSIIYVRNRKSCHDMARQLQSLGFDTTYYHGGLTSAEKQTNMQLWLEEKKRVIIATNAFGMGIDKSNVKTVIHIQLPENIESYYQEAGRAGRNNQKSFAVLLTTQNDIDVAKKQFLEVLPDKKFLKDIYIRINNYLQIAYGEGINESYAFNLNHFCQQYNLPVLKTYNALQFLDRQGVVTLSKEFSQKAGIQFLIPSKEVMRYISLNKSDEEMLLAILRNYSGVFDMETDLNTTLIAKKANAIEDEVTALLERLKEKNIISYKSINNDSQLTFNEVREDELTINRISKFLEKQNEIKLSQFESIAEYASNSTICKSRFILNYFDELTTSDCGICSYCLQKNKGKKDMKQLASQIIELLLTGSKSSQEIEQTLNLSAQETIEALQLLLENNKIKINTNNIYSIH